MAARSQDRKSRWTYAEFARLPSEGGARHEVIAGDLVMTPAPSRRHQRVSMDLGTLLNAFVRAHDLGEVYHGPFHVLLAEGDFLEPDLLFVRKERLHLLSDCGAEGPPDLVVEITSPSTSARDRGVKLERCRLYGVAEYWIVDPDGGLVEVWDLAAGVDHPVVLRAGQQLDWRPAGAEPTLSIAVADLVGDAA